MNDLIEIEVENTAGDSITHVIIDRGNGQFTSMPKAVWEEQQKAAKLGGTL
jgi:hypothetical protein